MRYFYLASPYSKYPHGLGAAHRLACGNAALLVIAGVKVYSPIAHTHPVAIHGGIDPCDHTIWLPADAPFMHHAFGLIVLRAQGWAESRGVTEEIVVFEQARKPIVYMAPGVVPMAEIMEALHAS